MTSGCAYKCKQCNVVSDDKVSWNIHLRSVLHGQRCVEWIKEASSCLPVCTSCQTVFATTDEEDEHLCMNKVKSEYNVFQQTPEPSLAEIKRRKQEICTSAMILINTSVDNEEDSNNKNKTTTAIYTCSICLFSDSSKEQMQTHLHSTMHKSNLFMLAYYEQNTNIRECGYALWIKYLPQEPPSPQEIKKVFQPFGTIRSIFLRIDHIFINYHEPEGAWKAFHYFHGRWKQPSDMHPQFERPDTIPEHRIDTWRCPRQCCRFTIPIWKIIERQRHLQYHTSYQRQSNEQHSCNWTRTQQKMYVCKYSSNNNNNNNEDETNFILSFLSPRVDLSVYEHPDHSEKNEKNQILLLWYCYGCNMHIQDSIHEFIGHLSSVSHLNKHTHERMIGEEQYEALHSCKLMKNPNKITEVWKTQYHVCKVCMFHCPILATKQWSLHLKSPLHDDNVRWHRDRRNPNGILPIKISCSSTSSSSSSSKFMSTTKAHLLYEQCKNKLHYNAHDKSIYSSLIVLDEDEDGDNYDQHFE